MPPEVTEDYPCTQVIAKPVIRAVAAASNLPRSSLDGIVCAIVVGAVLVVLTSPLWIPTLLVDEVRLAWRRRGVPRG